MSDGTTIEWTDATWNPITGCSVVSPGCTNCYAMKLAGTRLQHHPSRSGLTRDSKAGPVWTGEVRFNEDWLTQPLKWTRPRIIFVCAHGDLFHESVPDQWIDRVFAVMALAPQHRFQVLTKRSARMRAYIGEAAGRVVIKSSPPDHVRAVLSPVPWPLPNVWLGVSCEDQARADERIPHLLATPAAVRFVSLEPLLGAIDLTNLDHTGMCRRDSVNGISALWKGNAIGRTWLDWVIVGGESGPNARPMHPDWARKIRDDCAAAGVPFFFKQWGEWFPAIDRDNDDPDWRADYTVTKDDCRNHRILNLAGGHGFHGDRVHLMDRTGKKRAGRMLDGVEHSGMPA